MLEARRSAVLCSGFGGGGVYGVLARDAALSVGIRKATDTPGAFGRARVVSAGAGLSGPLAPLDRMARALKQFPRSP